MKRAVLTLLLIALLFGAPLVAPHTAAAAALVVDAAGGGSYTTIQAAVNHASPGDVITIMAGVYPESIDLSLMGSAIGGVPGDLTLYSPDVSAIVNGPGMRLYHSGSFGGSLTIDGLLFASEDNDAIVLTDVADLTIANSFFTRVGNSADDHQALDLELSSGASHVTVYRSTFEDIASSAVIIHALGTARTVISVADDTFVYRNSPQTRVGVLLITENSADARLTVEASDFSNLGSMGVSVGANNTSTIKAYIANSAFSNLSSSLPAINANANNTSSVDITIAGNDIHDILNGSAISLTLRNAGRMTGRVVRNTITRIGATAGNHAIAMFTPTSTTTARYFFGRTKYCERDQRQRLVCAAARRRYV